MNINHLAISWAVSRGQDTYGYPICRLDDRTSGKRFRTCGGGYDMIGTVFGDWLQYTYQARLMEIAHRAHGYWDMDRKTRGDLAAPVDALYGMTVYIKDRKPFRVSLDGGCGFESMRRIAGAIGLELQWEGNRKGHTIGYFVEDKSA